MSHPELVTRAVKLTSLIAVFLLHRPDSGEGVRPRGDEPGSEPVGPVRNPDGEAEAQEGRRQPALLGGHGERHLTVFSFANRGSI